jgi:hypothetical protein
MTMRVPTVAFVALIAVMVGCHRAPSAVPLDDLTFPVVLITGTHPSHVLPARADVFSNKAERGWMDTETYARINDTALTDAPIVIDATATAFDMKDIQGEHGGLWMMANPTSRMPIRFSLFLRQETGVAVARDIIAKSQYMGSDIDEQRTRLRAARILHAQSMAEIRAIVDEVPTATGPSRPHPFEPVE